MGREAEGGENSRYKSHLAAAQRIVDSGDEIALAFEDDIIIDTDSLTVIEASLQALQTRRLLRNKWIALRKKRAYSHQS